MRTPTEKQRKQMHREKKMEEKRDRTMLPDPRKEKAEQILSHTGWTTSYKK
jgi:hypothetical protein